MNDSDKKDRRVFLRSATAATLGCMGAFNFPSGAELPKPDAESSQSKNSMPQRQSTGREILTTGDNALNIGPWSDLPPQPIGLAGHFSWWEGDFLMAAGGSYWEGGKKYFVSSVWSYRLGDEIWLNSGKLPGPTCYVVGMMYEGSPYLFGGSNATKTLDDSFQLIIDHRANTAQFRALQPLPQPLECAGGGVAGTRAVIVGGASHFDDLSTYSKDVIWLDLAQSGAKWEVGPPLPGPGRCLPATAVCGDSLYVFGGFRHEKPDTLRNLSDAYAYDSRSDSWKRLAELPFPVRSASACSYGEKYILIAGGAGNPPEQPARFNTVLLYDIETNQYRHLKPLPHSVSVPYATVKGHRLYIVGGEPPDGNRVSRVISSAIHVDQK